MAYPTRVYFGSAVVVAVTYAVATFRYARLRRPGEVTVSVVLGDTLHAFWGLLTLGTGEAWVLLVTAAVAIVYSPVWCPLVRPGGYSDEWPLGTG